jgi:hypothetical protein
MPTFFSCDFDTRWFAGAAIGCAPARCSILGIVERGITPNASPA